MIGIVVVSHSRALADAAVALAGEMTDPANGPAIKIAAGLDAETFGTDAAAVAEAIGAADSGDGVLVLLDLGSAVLSAEMALEFVDPDVARRVRISSAPLVEGLVGAAVAAGAGADLEAVAAEAEQGLMAKSHHLGTGQGAVADETAKPRQKDEQDQRNPGKNWGETAVTREVSVSAPHGLHARPAARFVREVAAHPGVQVRVRNLETGRGPVDGRSLTAIATLDARQGHRLEIQARGAGAEEALDALSDLADSGFGDLAPTRATTAATAPPQTSPGTVPSSGTGPTYALEAAIGPAYRLDPAPELQDYTAGDPGDETEAYDRALAQARRELEQLRADTETRVGGAQAAVFDAHLAMLDDPALDEQVRLALREEVSAPDAVRAQVSVLRAQFEGLTDVYQRERGADVSSVGDRLLRALAGEASPSSPASVTLERPGILVVHELDPATAVQVDAVTTLGVLTVAGGGTGHGVLLARARGLPVLTGARAADTVEDGTVVAFDSRTGRLVIDPDEQTRNDFEELLGQRADGRRRMLEHAHEPAVTTDGHAVLVKANLASVAEAALAADSGADGSGLIRTEALFGDRAQAPSVAEQIAAFEQIAESLPGRTLTIRTWDVGGDKPLPFHTHPIEANPFLGLRGIRAFREDPRLLVDQLEAICRVAREHPLRVMFPMVTTVEEVDWALARLDEAAGRLPDGRPDALEVGIMIEVPAAALRAEALSALLDFVSIGSNDLTQYVLAAERGSALLEGLTDHADPAVLQLIRETCTGVAEGVEVGLCGDAASDPGLAVLLIGLGVTDLSATAASVPAVKDAIRAVSLVDAQDLAARALQADSAAEVRELLRR
ncbi:phosphoenolpyruvate--protein phosphotransferase [Ornithinimicrobium cryptoxanthini]|uniref:Phosphocarrier protein HPr n=1 Tax=Ornithinimicrobium cryptoxanthini TaxID=2934161 RepID=A0ABY4YFR0_9MICO|nr:phosphoenolpyruvate--protein phosphotransferase [Ornithinimicrobium cryptoxanthini]USQ75095.1 phosphoenolpyruvate--protein phosphotransferase [Ornithinimicrobium cryptoxanthini]